LPAADPGRAPAARALAFWRAWGLVPVLLLVLLAGVPRVLSAEAVLAGRVTRVIDGDTLDVPPGGGGVPGR